MTSSAGSLQDLDAVEMHAAMDSVLSTRAHEVRSHLGTIRNSLFVMKKRAEGDAPPEPSVDRSLQMLDRAASSIEAIHAERAPSVMPHESVTRDIAEAVRWSLGACRVGETEQLEVSIAPAKLHVSPVELAVALRAVVENALEAAGPQGARIDGEISGAEYVLAVTDQGGGFRAMDPGDATRPFMTSKPGRLGLGLSVARWICRRVDGRLVIESAAGGSRVKLVFRLAPADRQAE